MNPSDQSSSTNTIRILLTTTTTFLCLIYMGVNIVAVQKIISSMYWGRISDRILPWKSFLGMLLVWPRQFNDGHPNVIGFYSDRLMKIISSLTSYNSVFNTCVRCLPSVYFLYILNKAETWICSSPEERLFAMDHLRFRGPSRLRSGTSVSARRFLVITSRDIKWHL